MSQIFVLKRYKGTLRKCLYQVHSLSTYITHEIVTGLYTTTLDRT